MKQIRMLAQYYVDLMMKLGLVRFSLLLALALVVLAIVVQMAVTMVLHGQVESIDVIRSIFFGLLITPWAVYFLSVVVEQLEESRQRLSRLVQKLEEMRERDLKLNVQLKDNIAQLNQEIVEREKAEAERQEQQEKAMKRAYAKWTNANAEVAQEHPYLNEKGIAAVGVRQDKQGNLVVPGFDLETGRIDFVLATTPTSTRLSAPKLTATPFIAAKAKSSPKPSVQSVKPARKPAAKTHAKAPTKASSKLASKPAAKAQQRTKPTAAGKKHATSKKHH